MEPFIDNPFASPTSESPNVAPEAQQQGYDERIRRNHLRHERGIKAFGVLYVLGGALITVAFFVLPLVAISEMPDDSKVNSLALVITLAAAMVGIIQIVVAIGMIRLKAWARMPAVMLSILTMLGFPLGTLIGGLCLVLVLSKKGIFVCTPEYQRIIENTKHLKIGTPPIIWILLPILLLVLVVAIAAASAVFGL